jgi:hypothetical protein
MFLLWCGDVLPKVYNFVQGFGFGDRTRLRKRTTAETHTLAVSRSGRVITIDKNENRHFGQREISVGIVFELPIK